MNATGFGLCLLVGFGISGSIIRQQVS